MCYEICPAMNPDIYTFNQDVFSMSSCICMYTTVLSFGPAPIHALFLFLARTLAQVYCKLGVQGYILNSI